MYGQLFFGASLPLSSRFLIHGSEREGAPFTRPHLEPRLARLSTESHDEPDLHGRLKRSIEYHASRSREVGPGNVEVDHPVGGNRHFHEKTSSPLAHILEESETFRRRLAIFPFDYNARRQIHKE